MLKAFVDQYTEDWDEALSYLLFAYREVPVADYGYSPYELLFGRHMKGPLGVVYDSWWEKGKVSKHVVAHMIQLRERIEFSLKIVHENQAARQEKNKLLYDQKAREVTFKPGDLVLALQPLAGKPLTVKYIGPFKIIRQTSPVDYLVFFEGYRKKERNLHVNMLRAYVTRTEFINYISCPVLENVDSVDRGESASSIDSDDDPSLECLSSRPAVPTNFASLLADKVSHLSSTQREQVRQLILKYQTVISDTPGCTDVLEHVIRLKPDAKVVHLRPYRMSPQMQDKLKVEIDSLLADGLIVKSESEWSSPAIVVAKPDGGIRCVVDFRAANNQFVGDSFPLPLIDDLIDRIGQAQFLSKFDLSKGFYQLKLSVESRKYSAFCTPFGLFEFQRLPFGLKTSPAQFQYLIQKVLEGMSDFCGAFIDDIVVFSNSWTEHLQHVQMVLERLLNAKLTVKLSKCSLACHEIEYLGHKVGGGKMSPREVKVKALLDMPRPVNRKQVQSFLGSTGYYQRYVPRYAELVSPLTSLLKKNQIFSWSNEAELSYIKLKEYLSNAPVLVIADFRKPFFLFIDASNVAVSAILMQVGDDGLYHPVSYYSHKLNAAQKNYSTVERESLALILAARSFRIYLSGHVIVYSDHEPLSFIGKMATKNSRLLRWSLELAAYDITVCHIKGRANFFADFLSRPSVTTADPVDVTYGPDVPGVQAVSGVEAAIVGGSSGVSRRNVKANAHLETSRRTVVNFVAS